VQRLENGSYVTGFARVLILLEPGDLTLGQRERVADRVAVVELGVNNGSGDDGRCFGVEVWTHTAKMMNMVIARFGDRKDELVCGHRV